MTNWATRKLGNRSHSICRIMEDCFDLYNHRSRQHISWINPNINRAIINGMRNPIYWEIVAALQDDV